MHEPSSAPLSLPARPFRGVPGAGAIILKHSRTSPIPTACARVQGGIPTRRIGPRLFFAYLVLYADLIAYSSLETRFEKNTFYRVDRRTDRRAPELLRWCPTRNPRQRFAGGQYRRGDHFPRREPEQWRNYRVYHHDDRRPEPGTEPEHDDRPSRRHVGHGQLRTPARHASRSRCSPGRRQRV
jgi:hypothetical protein